MHVAILVCIYSSVELELTFTVPWCLLETKRAGKLLVLRCISFLSVSWSFLKEPLSYSKTILEREYIAIHLTTDFCIFHECHLFVLQYALCMCTTWATSNTVCMYGSSEAWVHNYRYVNSIIILKPIWFCNGMFCNLPSWASIQNIHIPIRI